MKMSTFKQWPSLTSYGAKLCLVLLIASLGIASSSAFGQTGSNVPVFRVSPSVAGAQFSVGSHKLSGEEFSSSGAYYVHGLRVGDFVQVSAPGFAAAYAPYQGEAFVDVSLLYTGAYRPPAPSSLWFAAQSATPGSATVWRGRIIYAGTLWWPSYPVFIGDAQGAYHQTPERSTTGVALATYRDRVFASYSGVGNQLLNVISTADGGASYQKITLPYKSPLKSSLCACGNKLLLVWSDLSQQVNTLESADGVSWGAHRVLPIYSKRSPSAIHFAGNDYLAYVGGPFWWEMTDQIRLMRWNGASWDAGPALNELTQDGPVLSVSLGRLFALWRGADHNHLVNSMELDASMNPGTMRTYNFSTTVSPFFLDYAFSPDRASVEVESPLLFSSFNSGSNISFAHFFDDGVFGPKNSSFENGLSNWWTYSPQPWFAPHISNFSSDGSSSVQLDSLGIVYQDVGSLESGKTYTISAFVAGNGSGASAHLSVHDTQGQGYSQSSDLVPGGYWQRISTTFKATQTGLVRIHLVRNDGAAGPIYFDGVSITPE